MDTEDEDGQDDDNADSERGLLSQAVCFVKQDKLLFPLQYQYFR